MALSTQTMTQLVAKMAAAIQGAATQLVDLTVGSILLAFSEATAAVTLWLQGLALAIASLTRFATSYGTDADSFGADFGFPRLLAKGATGQVTFARFTATNAASIPLGTVAQTPDGTQTYAVIADTTEAAYNPSTQTYGIAAGVPSATVTVRAVTPGAASNVGAGLISVLGSALPYVDTVSNLAPFTNGADAETDPAYKARFVLWFNSLSQGTLAAVTEALESLSTTINFQIVENYSYSGAWQPGYFYVIVDDGTGYPNAAYLAAAYAAIDKVRPLTSTFGVFGPVVEIANVALTLITASAYVHATVVTLVEAAVLAYIDALQTGTSLPLTRIANVAYGIPGVTNVTGITINGIAADLVATPAQIVKAGTVAAA